jgi:hypothetical protein
MSFSTFAGGLGPEPRPFVCAAHVASLVAMVAITPGECSGGKFQGSFKEVSTVKLFETSRQAVSREFQGSFKL